MTNHKGLFLVSGELLREVLLLPPGTEVVGVRMDFDSDMFELKVRGDATSDLPAVNEGELIPLLHPCYDTIDGKPRFAGWGM